MKRILAVIAAVTVLSLQAAAQNNAPDAGALISDATKAMGTTSLRSLQYTGTGSINPTGQAYTTGGAWPRYTVTKYTMSIDYSVPAMRQELVRIDDAKVPRGGGAGGYNPQTFQGGIRPIPGDIIQNNTITSSGANFATNAIYSAGTSAAIFNSGIIFNNFIQDYFNAASVSVGINLSATGNSAWSIASPRTMTSFTGPVATTTGAIVSRFFFITCWTRSRLGASGGKPSARASREREPSPLTNSLVQRPSR